MGGHENVSQLRLPAKVARAGQAAFARHAAGAMFWEANGLAERGQHAAAQRVLHGRAQLLDGARANLGEAGAELADLT